MKTGILLLNLGTPDDTSVTAVRRYLREFLSDPRVIDIPKVARWILLNCIILPFRPKQSAKAYRQIWQAQGSPLLIYSQQLATAVRQALGDGYEVELGMRYGQPAIDGAVQRLLAQHCDQIMVLPLFPQYSSAATGSAIEKALEHIQQHWNIPSIRVRSDFYGDPLFIDAYAKVIAEHLPNDNEFVLFSYHGLPERHIDKSGCDRLQTCDRQGTCPAIGDNNRYCYRGQCYATSRQLAQALHLNDAQYDVAFQSRLGRTPWIKPYTDLLLPQLAEQGIKNLTVVCPSFVADCLETLEEVGMRAREQWLELGGQQFTLIPCLNAHPAWVKAVVNFVKDTNN